MKQPIGILIVEDTPEFMGQISHELRQARLHFHAKQIASKDAFVRELECHRPDVILSNGGLASLDGMTALAIAREKRPDVPFIFVSVEPRDAVLREMNRTRVSSGALKSCLPELGRTVRQALREGQRRLELQEAELMVLTSRWLAR